MANWFDKNWFFGPIARQYQSEGLVGKFYEGPLNDIRQKVIEDMWFYKDKTTGDFKWTDVGTTETKAEPAKEAPTAPKPGLSEAHFTEVYGPPMEQTESPRIEPPTIDQPRIQGPRIDP